MSAKHFLYLDGMRGLAAMVVVADHCAQIFAKDYNTLPSAHLAVDFFFCLSGFVVANAYEAKLDNKMTWPEFMRVRIIRLWPLLLLGASVGLICLAPSLSHAGRHPLFRAVLTTLPAFVLFPSGLLLHQSLFPTDPPMWSLFWEMVANALFAVTVLRKRLNGVGALVVSAVGLIIAAVVHGDVNSLDMSIAGGVRVMYPFLSGVAIYHVRQQTHALERVTTQTGALLASAALAVVLLAPFSTIISDLFFIFFVFPLVVNFGMAEATGRTVWMLRVLGELSYPLYLIHFPILLVASRSGVFEAAYHQHPVACTIGLLMGCSSAALLASRVYDVPVRHWLNRATAAKRPVRILPVSGTLYEPECRLDHNRDVG